MKKILILPLIVFVLLGCSANSSESSSNHKLAIPLNTVLGWNNHLYKIVKAVDSTNSGKILGKVGYRGQVSGSFTIRELKGANSSKSILFEDVSGQYYEAVQTK